MSNELQSALINAIRKTTNRFRERPLNYFTESDIHSSLMKDIIEGNSKYFLLRLDEIHSEISLIHNEYPTNFRYKKTDLMDYLKTDSRTNWGVILEKTRIDKKYGTRGNYDLSILNKKIINSLHNQINTKNDSLVVDKKTKNNPVFHKMEIVKHIINKDIDYPIARYKEDEKEFIEELLYAIEVKYIHPFNARNSNMLSEVIKDNSKLKLAKVHTSNFLKTINLVFCSSQKKVRSNKTAPVIEKVRKYITEREVQNYKGIKFIIPEGIINVFISSYFDGETKNTPKPVISINANANEEDETLAEKLARALHTKLVKV